jgi:hypothetical protein
MESLAILPRSYDRVVSASQCFFQEEVAGASTKRKYNTSLLRPVGLRPKGSAAKITYTSLVIALLSSSPDDSRLVPSSPIIALLFGPP